MKKLALLIPTNNKDNFDNIFMKSIKNISQIKDDLLLAINFQQPYSLYDISVRVNKLRDMGFEVKYRFGEYCCKPKGAIPFNKIRYDCATLCQDAEIFGLCDDDFEFTSDASNMIKEILNKFDTDKNLGLVQCTHKPLFYPRDYFKLNAKKHDYYTDNGFFFRNLHKEDKDILVYPNTALKCLGAGEEYIIGLEIAKHGYDVYLRTYSSIIHHTKRFENGESPHGWGSEEIMYGENGIYTYIMDNYGNFIKRSELND